MALKRAMNIASDTFMGPIETVNPTTARDMLCNGFHPVMSNAQTAMPRGAMK
eukprot:CAMPEP_0115177762 /NCGR_PEP_ID=MMETSP0270-20121206/5547_1 /TAXON_ID=71861 /ORGANISM="Scrippsiella trochoidea, Strain CCMP3099" /LENGTH=51 /DNA_ID=CAMNT_0002590693 /DNA_START=351 /DNA_END=506 /DNA_ORIENTATION=-